MKHLSISRVALSFLLGACLLATAAASPARADLFGVKGLNGYVGGGIGIDYITAETMPVGSTGDDSIVDLLGTLRGGLEYAYPISLAGTQAAVVPLKNVFVGVGWAVGIREGTVLDRREALWQAGGQGYVGVSFDIDYGDLGFRDFRLGQKELGVYAVGGVHREEWRIGFSYDPDGVGTTFSGDAQGVRTYLYDGWHVGGGIRHEILRGLYLDTRVLYAQSALDIADSGSDHDFSSVQWDMGVVLQF